MSSAGAQPGEPLARRITHQLITGRRSQDDGDTAARAAACDRLYRDLSRWVGPDGCHALFTRALAESLTEYPLLAEVQLRPRSEPYVEGAADTARSHGDAVTAEALESIIVHVIELLRRLVGDDMAIKLIERSLAASEGGDALSDDVQGEAG
ncbi:MAG TPA: hypothetical protein VMM17_08730 [Gemmatimonadaceae bacterium]|nr:hypothetical protein [Gemmatimonadaceae bacterium]